MIIAVDEALPFWKEAFSNLGEIRPFSGRTLKPAGLRDVDALIVRTVTPVNADLLQGSTVRFVGAASAGIDHIDQDFLKKNNIHLYYSAGCNANSVSEYIFTALYATASRKHWDLKRKSLAVIGVGHVGSRVAQKGRALGMEVMLCDPPLHDLTGDPHYQSLEEVLCADILSFHVPLISDGPYPTRHMLDSELLSRLSPDQFIINASRGSVIDSPAVKTALQQHRISGAILDVWEGEPEIDYSLLESIDIGTPHIAGTSMDGKIQATNMVRKELHRFLSVNSPEISYSSGTTQTLSPKPCDSGQDAVLSVLLQAFDILKTDNDLRALGSLPAEKASAGFDRLRQTFPLRPEFHHFIVHLDKMNIDLTGIFRALGFQVLIEKAG
jgi:erythronate-4-phosphate dehydrogenase